MKSKHLSVPLVGCLALAPVIAGCSGTSDPLAQEATPAQTAAPYEGQAHIALATLKLENQFSDQFRRGAIDRAALQPAVDDVLRAMPEAVRPKVQQHVADVLGRGEKLAPQLTSEQRAALTAAPPAERLGKTEIDIISAWGFPGAV